VYIPNNYVRIIRTFNRGVSIETEGESNEGKTLKDTAMLKRLNDISALPDKDKEHILYTIDGLIKSAKLQAL
jgi:hypothetical protein